MNRHDVKHKATQLYCDQCKRTVEHQLPDIAYSKEEFVAWLMSQPNQPQLWQDWEQSGYSRWLAPSVDRLDDYKGYSLDNIRLTTWKENFDRGHHDRKAGINNKMSRAVNQFNLDGSFIAKHESLAIAARHLGNLKLKRNIQLVCEGKRQTASGYIWKYVES